MHPEKIKAELRIAGYTQAMLADELGVASSSIGQTITGRIHSNRIQTCISKIIKKPVKEIWPEQKIVLRRNRQQIEEQKRSAA